MSASGFTPIQLYRSATPGATPSAGNLAAGELAVNTADEKLFFKNAGGTVVAMAVSAAGTVTSVAASGGTTGLTFGGSPITTSGTLTLSGTLAVANGGTGATTLTANNVILGNGTSAVQFVAPGASGNVLTSNGTTWTSATAAASLTGVTQSVTPFETALGFEAGLNTTGVANTFIGYQAGKATTNASDNTAVGYRALDANTSGEDNVALGSEALGANTTASSNTAVGALALLVNTTGALNTAIGYGALDSNTTASNNTALGHSAGDAITTGTQNTILGASAGSSGTNDLTTGSNNIVVGYNAAASAAAAANEITLGNSSIATLRCQVTTITSLSDLRDKANIVYLDAGLDFIKALCPVRFTWNMRDGGKVGEEDTGFIAQDLQAAMADTGINIPGLVYDVNPDKLEAGYGKLLPVLVKAIQELSAEVDALKAARDNA